jgi:hypothetical protein
MWVSIATTIVPTFGTKELVYLWLFYLDFKFFLVLAFAKDYFKLMNYFK